MGAGALDGLLVVELAQGVAGPYCGRLLAAQGARVIKVEPPGGDRARFLLPRVEGAPATESGALFAWLNANKQSRVLHAARPAELDRLKRLCAAADVVIDDGLEADRAAQGLDNAGLRALQRRAVLCRFSWFGQDGPYSRYAGSDAICLALSGLAFNIGEREGPPMLPSGYQAQVIAGVVGSIAVLASLIGRGEDRAGHDIDLSIHESNLVLVETGAIARSYEQHSPPQRFGVNRFPPTYPMGVYRCADGWVGITALTPSQWQAFCELLGIATFGRDPRFYASIDRFVLAEEIEPVLTRAIARWPARELMLQGQARRIPLALVPTPAEILDSPEFRERGALDAIRCAGGREFQAPGIPFRLQRTPGRGAGSAPGLDQHDSTVPWPEPEPEPEPATPGGVKPALEQPLAGVSIVDLSKGWAGPLAARLFADLGADVVKVEDCRYPDWWRGWEATREWVEQKLYEKNPAFNTMNRNKLGITLDLTRDEGRALLLRLVRGADLVVENYTSTVLPSLKVHYPELVKVNPELIMIAMPAYGLTSPWSHHRAYGSTVEQAAGLPHLNGRPDWPPTQQHVALGDAISGLNAASALLAALYHKRRTGQGQLIDLSQVECLLPLGAHGVIECSVNGRTWPRLGSRHAEQAPRGVYACAGEEAWLAVDCETDDHWRALTQVIGRPRMAPGTRLDTAAQRKAAEDELDAWIAAWAATRAPDVAMAQLQAVGVPAAVVTSVQNLLDDPHLQARGAFEWGPGVHRDLVIYPLPAFLLNGQRPGVRWAAPMLGEHNAQVLGGRLGMSEVELAGLRERNVIGDRPLIDGG